MVHFQSSLWHLYLKHLGSYLPLLLYQIGKQLLCVPAIMCLDASSLTLYYLLLSMNGPVPIKKTCKFNLLEKYLIKLHRLLDLMNPDS